MKSRQPWLLARRRWLVVVGASLLGAVIAALAGVGAPHPTGTHGDLALAGQVRAQIADDAGFASLSVARVTTTQITWAGLGSPTPTGGELTEQTPYPLGSITKTFDGLLLADAITRGEVRPQQRLETLLPTLAGSPAGGVTLDELASHRSGLPRLAPSDGWGALLFVLTLRDPYRLSPQALIAEARDVQLSGRGEVAYSNFGAALLGHALAVAAHAPDWPTLVRQRIWAPLGMTNTSIATTPDRVPAGAVVERTASGARPQTWTNDGDAPAGSSTWTTAADLARYAQAILLAKVPGMSALDGRWPVPEGKIGLFWFSGEVENRQLTWHDGGVAGARTMLVLDRSAGLAYVVLGSSDRSVEDIGLGLITGRPAQSRPGLPITGLVVLLVTLTALGSVLHGLAKPGHRVGVVGDAVLGLAMLVLLFRVGPWAVIPGWVFGLVAGAAAGLIALAGPRWRDLTAPRHPIRAGLGVAFAALVLGVVCWGLLR